MPEYQIKEWNETNSPLDSRYARAAHAKGLWSRLTNLVRLHALYTEGGVYLDTDVEVLKSFSPLLVNKCFVGFQQEAEKDADWVNTAVMGAQPGYPFLERCAELVEKGFEEKGEFLRSPTITTALLKEMGLRGYGIQEVEGVTIYPTEYFYPYPWFGKLTPDCITPNTYCIHHWEGTWRKKDSTKTLLPLRIAKRVVRTLISTYR